LTRAVDDTWLRGQDKGPLPGSPGYSLNNYNSIHHKVTSTCIRHCQHGPMIHQCLLPVWQSVCLSVCQHLTRSSGLVNNTPSATDSNGIYPAIFYYTRTKFSRLLLSGLRRNRPGRVSTKQTLAMLRHGDFPATQLPLRLSQSRPVPRRAHGDVCVTPINAIDIGPESGVTRTQVCV